MKISKMDMSPMLNAYPDSVENNIEGFGEFLVFRSLRNCLDCIIINCKKFHDFKRKKHSNQRELGKFIILSYSYNEAMHITHA